MFNTAAYRYPTEQRIFAITIFIVLAVIAVTATATLCGSFLFVCVMVAAVYVSTRARHSELIGKAQHVTGQNLPDLDAIIQKCKTRLQVEPVQTFIVPSRALNAYTFGLSSPKAIVVYSPLLQLMDADELAFIIGHEMGHVRLGHTWLNSLLGGMAGIPSPFMASIILQFAFLWWNRACEYSADRAGLLACGRLDKAISALVRLATGTASRTSAALAHAYQLVDAEDDQPTSGLVELLAGHPLMIKRVEELRRWAATAEYTRLQAGMNRNQTPSKRSSNGQ